MTSMAQILYAKAPIDGKRRINKSGDEAHSGTDGNGEISPKFTIALAPSQARSLFPCFPKRILSEKIFLAMWKSESLDLNLIEENIHIEAKWMINFRATSF